MKKSELSTIKLSIIIPLLNASGDVEGVFLSLFNQNKVDLKEFEIIIVDDGSTDTTLKEIERFKTLLKGYRNVSIISHDSREGLPKTRLDGAKYAKGKFITFVDKKIRPDQDYFYNLLNKNRNIVIGNVYINKKLGPWSLVLSLIREKLYYPYFNHDFKDVVLDYEAYKLFKNKGGGSAMLVLRDYFIDASKNQSLSMDSNDDSMLIEALTKKEPLLKTSSARAQYLNRTGFLENIIHLYNRGPKFFDYYGKIGSRFFNFILLYFLILFFTILFIFIEPSVLLIELAGFLIVNISISLYISKGLRDFFTSIYILPLAAVAFATGVFKGAIMKLLRLY